MTTPQKRKTPGDPDFSPKKAKNPTGRTSQLWKLSFDDFFLKKRIFTDAFFAELHRRAQLTPLEAYKSLVRRQLCEHARRAVKNPKYREKMLPTILFLVDHDTVKRHLGNTVVASKLRAHHRLLVDWGIADTDNLSRIICLEAGIRNQNQPTIPVTLAEAEAYKTAHERGAPIFRVMFMNYDIQPNSWTPAFAKLVALDAIRLVAHEPVRADHCILDLAAQGFVELAFEVLQNSPSLHRNALSTAERCAAFRAQMRGYTSRMRNMAEAAIPFVNGMFESLEINNPVTESDGSSALRSIGFIFDSFNKRVTVARSASWTLLKSLKKLADHSSSAMASIDREIAHSRAILDIPTIVFVRRALPLMQLGLPSTAIINIAKRAHPLLAELMTAKAKDGSDDESLMWRVELSMRRVYNTRLRALDAAEMKSQ